MHVYYQWINEQESVFKCDIANTCFQWGTNVQDKDHHYLPNTAADPGFPQGGRQLPRGAPTYDFAKFSRKLHEFERIWVPGGGAPLAPTPLNPPLEYEMF